MPSVPSTASTTVFHTIADVRLRRKALLQDALRPEPVAAMDHRHLRGEVRQVERLLHRRVAAADHGDVLAAEEEPVAGGAGGHAEARQLPLARDAEPARLGAGRDHHGVAEIGVARIAHGAERPRGEVHARHHVLHHLGADMARLGAELLHEPGPLHRLGEARVVLHIGGDGELPARLQPRDEDRLQPCARGVDRRGVAGGAGADDQEARAMRGGHWRRFPEAADPVHIGRSARRHKPSACDADVRATILRAERRRGQRTGTDGTGAPTPHWTIWTCDSWRSCRPTGA